MDPGHEAVVAVSAPQLLGAPIFLDVEAPPELQVGLVIVVDEARDGFVVAAADDAARGGFGLDCNNSSRQRRGALPSQVQTMYAHFFSYSGLSVVFGE